MRVGIAGLGAIGGALARLLDAPGSDPAVPGSPTVEELAAEVDLVIVAVPPRATVEVVRRALAAGALVADACSVKRPVAQAVEDPRFLPAHPLAGPGDLAGAPWAVCPSGSPEPLLALSEALEPIGASFLVVDPDEHDAAVARTSHVPHVIAHALARLAGPYAALSGGALRDMTRVAGGDEGLWREILELNRDNVEAALAELAIGGLGGGPGRAQIESRRWAEREWRPAEAHWPAWDELRGRAVRRLSLAGGLLRFEEAPA